MDLYAPITIIIVFTILFALLFIFIFFVVILFFFFVIVFLVLIPWYPLYAFNNRIFQHARFVH
ncbi:hypothetical protein CC80DRAFT_493761 [Byssothecium circinans]|uniref:Uncharacterized protein n=1 Tax=Byssothecium circinans TaxID=147558 RepID=A0A6A5TSD4_9PLEO|nr:hypothetical protein CC80DRAFT_493761 [Byssothecium circinans]